MTALHKTPEEIDGIEMLDALSLLNYWRDWPPMHEVLFLANGGKPPAHSSKSTISDKDDPSGIGAMLSMFPDGKAKSLPQ